VKISKTMYHHFRYDKKGRLKRYVRANPEFRPLPNGGATFCVVLLETGELGMGESVCQPEDTFVYATGRERAYDRAVNDVRRYFERCNKCGQDPDK
jgi:hypothetical protein